MRAAISTVPTPCAVFRRPARDPARMRPAGFALILMLALAGVARVFGDDTPPTSTTAPPAGPTHTTTVEGTAPALEGRWLLLASLGLAQGSKRIIPSAFDVRR